MITQINSINWQCLQPNAKNVPEHSLAIPGYFPITTDNCSISWNCHNCDYNVNFKWPVSPLDNLKLIKVPATKYFDIELLMKLVDVDDRFELITNKELSYIKDLQTNMSPSLILVDCSKCCHQYLLSYSIGVGQESRPPEPNTFAIRNLWYMGQRDNKVDEID